LHRLRWNTLCKKNPAFSGRVKIGASQRREEARPLSATGVASSTMQTGYLLAEVLEESLSSAWGRTLGRSPEPSTVALSSGLRVFGWVPVDPADVRKVALEEPPGNLPLSRAKVQEARKKLFGYREMNWLAYNRAHDVQLPGASGWKVPYFMYPDGQTSRGRLAPLGPELFQYTITAKELKAV
jgi:hypothetical protein